MFFQLYYLPCIEFFIKSQDFNPIYFDENEHYSKQSYRTRCYIIGANKIEQLNIPVNKKKLSKDVTIDYSENWQRTHWRTIQAAYNKSPFFEHYEHMFEGLFSKKIKYLMEFNQQALSICHKALKMNKTICLTAKKAENSPVYHINAKNRLNDPNYFEYLPYSQNFGNKFEPNMSIIDLIFNKGPESLQYINFRSPGT